MKKTSFGLIFCVALLFSIGLIMVFNTTSAEMLDRQLQKNIHQAVLKQGVYALLGIAFAFGLYRYGYDWLIQHIDKCMFMGVLLLLAVFIPHIGQELNGAKRWIGLFGLTFQPSEFIKFLLPIYSINHILRKEMDFAAFTRHIFVISIPLFLILIEPDNGTVAILMMTLTMLFFLTKVRWTYWLIPLMIIALIGGGLALQMPHVKHRIRVYLHPESDLLGKGHQPYQAKIAAGSGGLLGRGLGQSLQKLNYLPEARSDYIAAIYAEEFGFVGILALMFLYMTIALFGFSIAIRAKSLEGFYIAAILTFLISFQAFLNLGVVCALLPSKGTNLPFFSQGGSSLVANIMTISLILSVSKASKQVVIRN